MKHWGFKSAARLLTIAVAAGGPSFAHAVVIDNDVPTSTVGAWTVNVTTGGESRTAGLTANRFASGDVYHTDVLYDYFTYIDVGNGGFRLAGSTATLSGDDQVTSTGSFLGSAGNTINWTAVSSIADGTSVLQNTFSFSAATGTLGNLRLFQYMDEDVQGVSDDVFFTRGSVAGLDLELFTVDNAEVYGVSHSGALSADQGLLDAVFAGWAVCKYNQMKPTIRAGTQAVSPDGIFCADMIGPFDHPQVGTAWGPQDVVSVLAWDAVATASRATIITTLGGVPNVNAIRQEDDTPLPAPAAMLLVAAGLLGLRRSAGRQARA